MRARLNRQRLQFENGFLGLNAWAIQFLERILYTNNQKIINRKENRYEHVSVEMSWPSFQGRFPVQGQCGPTETLCYCQSV